MAKFGYNWLNLIIIIIIIMIIIIVYCPTPTGTNLVWYPLRWTKHIIIIIVIIIIIIIYFRHFPKSKIDSESILLIKSYIISIKKKQGDLIKIWKCFLLIFHLQTPKISMLHFLCVTFWRFFSFTYKNQKYIFLSP